MHDGSTDATTQPAPAEPYGGGTAPGGPSALADPARLHLLAETGLLDAAAAARLPTLERVARLAARATRAPVAQVNLVTADAQVPAAAFVEPGAPDAHGRPLDGADAALGGAWRVPVGLDRSLCQYVVADGAPLAIADTTREARTAEHDATTRSGVRAYAAAPLRTPSGHVLGTVCVVDFAPRAWSASDLAVLEECVALAGEEVAARLGAAQALRDAAVERVRLLAAEREARQEAERERRELAAVLAVVPVGIGIARDPECREIQANAALAEQLGFAGAGAPPGNVSKSGPAPDRLPFRVLQHGRELTAEELPMQRAAREARAIAGELFDIVHADGRVVKLLEYAVPLLDVQGQVRGAVGAFVDVTERERLLAGEREARAEAEEARRRADEANRAKSEFLAMMSHELRTPLNAIAGYAELLALGVHGPVVEAQRTALERIQRSQQHLLGLINGVLNYARIDAGALAYAREVVPLAEVLATCEALVAPQAQSRALALTLHACAPDVAALADREKVQQVVLNLLSNAIKFTPAGGRIAVACEDRDGAVWLHVTDTGPGIAPAEQERVFQPFVQIDARLTRAQEGTGLGLAISRDLARGMNGDLTLESAPGAGSTFTLRLPRA